jgi:hypothetical protein
MSNFIMNFWNVITSMAIKRQVAASQVAAKAPPKGRLMAEERRERLGRKICPNLSNSPLLFPNRPKNAQNGNCLFHCCNLVV